MVRKYINSCPGSKFENRKKRFSYKNINYEMYKCKTTHTLSYKKGKHY